MFATVKNGYNMMSGKEHARKERRMEYSGHIPASGVGIVCTLSRWKQQQERARARSRSRTHTHTYFVISWKPNKWNRRTCCNRCMEKLFVFNQFKSFCHVLCSPSQWIRVFRSCEICISTHFTVPATDLNLNAFDWAHIQHNAHIARSHTPHRTHARAGPCHAIRYVLHAPVDFSSFVCLFIELNHIHNLCLVRFFSLFAALSLHFGLIEVRHIYKYIDSIWIFRYFGAWLDSSGVFLVCRSPSLQLSLRYCEEEVRVTVSRMNGKCF